MESTLCVIANQWVTAAWNSVLRNTPRSGVLPAEMISKVCVGIRRETIPPVQQLLCQI